MHNQSIALRGDDCVSVSDTISPRPHGAGPTVFVRTTRDDCANVPARRGGMSRLEESHNARNTEIQVPSGFRAANKCCRPLIAAAGGDVGRGTALWARVGWGIP